MTGYDAVVDWTAASLRDTGAILLNRAVETIHWNEDGSQRNVIECRLQDGSMSQIHADAVVCTIPLGCLRHDLVRFEPALPQDIQTGISRFSYGALGKIFFEFADVFWSKDNDQFIYYPSPPEIEQDDIYGSSVSSGSSTRSVSDNILHYATVTINLWIMTGAKELCVQIAEPLTQRIEAMTDTKEIYRFFKPLFKLLGTESYKALPRLTNITSTKWFVALGFEDI